MGSLWMFLPGFVQEVTKEMEDCCAVCAEPLEWLAYGPSISSKIWKVAMHNLNEIKFTILD